MKSILIFSFLMLFFDIALASECPVGEYWVDPYFRRGYVRYDGVSVSPADVRGHCRTNPRGYEKWNQRLSNSRPKIWGYKIEKSKKWTVEDLERVYDSLEQILFHELSHVFYEELPRETKDDFANVAEWTKDKGAWVPKKDKVFVEEDSGVSVEEDFANQIEHYLIKNDSLKKNSPKVYNWIKKKFGDDFKIQEKK